MIGQDFRPSLFFVVKDKSEEHDLRKLDFRIKKIMESLKQPLLEKVEILRKTEFMDRIDQL